MEHENRPQIKISLTASDKVVEVLSILLLVAFWCFTFLHYKSLPEVIPTHFKANGTVDGYGPKWTFFLLPILTLFFYIGLTLASRFPHKFNYMIEITEQNANKQYGIASQMLRVMKLCVILVFFAIDYKTVHDVSSATSNLDGWFMLMIMSLIFFPIFYFLIQFSKNS